MESGMTRRRGTWKRCGTGRAVLLLIGSLFLSTASDTNIRPADMLGHLPHRDPGFSRAGPDELLRGVFTRDEVVSALEEARHDLACAREKAIASKDNLVLSAARFRQARVFVKKMRQRWPGPAKRKRAQGKPDGEATMSGDVDSPIESLMCDTPDAGVSMGQHRQMGHRSPDVMELVAEMAPHSAQQVEGILSHGELVAVEAQRPDRGEAQMDGGSSTKMVTGRGDSRQFSGRRAGGEFDAGDGEAGGDASGADTRSAPTSMLPSAYRSLGARQPSLRPRPEALRPLPGGQARHPGLGGKADSAGRDTGALQGPGMEQERDSLACRLSQASRLCLEPGQAPGHERRDAGPTRVAPTPPVDCSQSGDGDLSREHAPAARIAATAPQTRPHQVHGGVAAAADCDKQKHAPAAQEVIGRRWAGSKPGRHELDLAARAAGQCPPGPSVEGAHGRNAAEAQEAAEKAAKLEAEALAQRQAEEERLEKEEAAREAAEAQEAAEKAAKLEAEALAQRRAEEERLEKEEAAREAAEAQEAAEKAAKLEAEALAQRQAEEERLEKEEAAREAAEAQEAAEKAAKLEAEALAQRQAEEERLEKEEAAREAAEAQEAAEKAAKLEAEALAQRRAEEQEQEHQARLEEAAEKAMRLEGKEGKSEEGAEEEEAEEVQGREASGTDTRISASPTHADKPSQDSPRGTPALEPGEPDKLLHAARQDESIFDDAGHDGDLCGGALVAFEVEDPGLGQAWIVGGSAAKIMTRRGDLGALAARLAELEATVDRQSQERQQKGALLQQTASP